MLLFVAAMGARESAWTLPFALVLVEVARGERMREALRRTLPFWGLALVLAALVLAIAPYRQLLATSLSIRSPLDNLVAQVDSVVYLVTHPLLTLRLNFDPDLVARESIDGAWLAKVATLAALLALGIAQLRKRPWLGFGVLWFFLALAPTHGPLARYELANDRQLYLAIVGPALVAGVLLASWSARSGRQRRPRGARSRARRGDVRARHRLRERGPALGGDGARVAGQRPRVEQPRPRVAGRRRPGAGSRRLRAGARDRSAAQEGARQPGRAGVALSECRCRARGRSRRRDGAGASRLRHRRPGSISGSIGCGRIPGPPAKRAEVALRPQGGWRPGARDAFAPCLRLRPQRAPVATGGRSHEESFA